MALWPCISMIFKSPRNEVDQLATYRATPVGHLKGFQSINTDLQICSTDHYAASTIYLTYDSIDTYGETKMCFQSF